MHREGLILYVDVQSNQSATMTKDKNTPFQSDDALIYLFVFKIPINIGWGECH